MRRRGNPTPWGVWAVGWLIATVLTGGVVYVITDTESPLRVVDDPVGVETSIQDVHVLPEGQAKVTGSITALRATDAVAAPLRAPLEFPAGARATIAGAIVNGRRSTIAWDGGRPLVLQGNGGIDLGPTTLEVDGTGAVSWPVDDGVRALLTGEYVIRTPVAVGQGGLAQPRDQVTFVADDETTIETHGVTLRTSPAALKLEGPGSLVLDGALAVESRDGRRNVAHLEFGPGSFVVELAPGPDGVTVTATLQGPLS